ncbi:unnamed protein product [Urochloa humidicola]
MRERWPAVSASLPRCGWNRGRIYVGAGDLLRFTPRLALLSPHLPTTNKTKVFLHTVRTSSVVQNSSASCQEAFLALRLSPFLPLGLRIGGPSLSARHAPPHPVVPTKHNFSPPFLTGQWIGPSIVSQDKETTPLISRRRTNPTPPPPTTRCIEGESRKPDCIHDSFCYSCVVDGCHGSMPAL